ncbi:MAG: CoA-binding protein [Dehalococcoidia bacterium]
MSILIDDTTQVLVQGITSHFGTTEAQRMLDYGTMVVAGVTPGKGGQEVCGLPVYDSVAEAVEKHQIDVAVNYAPARAAKDSVIEAIRAGIPLATVSAERIPIHDIAAIMEEADRFGTRVIGPNTQGIASPGKARLGGVGGDLPARTLLPGPVGIASKSGGMGTEMCWLLTQAGIGQSTYVSTGGEAIMGTSFRDLLAMYEEDEQTEVVVLFGEAGSRYEDDAAAFIAEGGFTKPAIAFVAGRFAEQLPGVRFGHGGAIIEGKRGTPSEKVRAFEEAGVTVLGRLSQLVPHVQKLLA